MEVQPAGTSRFLGGAQSGPGKRGIGRVDKERNDGRRRDQLVQQFQPFRHYLHGQLSRARDVAAGAAKADDEAELDRVGARFKHDRNGCGCCLCGERRRSSGRGNHFHLTMYQLSRHRR
jgi:hypothetical protein